MSKKNASPNFTIRERVDVQHSFSSEEYKAKSEILAQRLNDVALKKEAVKAAAATAKAEIKAMESEVSELANQLRMGAENKPVEAIVEFNRKNGQKTYRFADGPEKGKVIKKVAMTEDDFQRLPLEEKEPEPAKEAPAGKPLVETLTQQEMPGTSAEGS